MEFNSGFKGLKTTNSLLDIRNQSVPRYKHFPPVFLKTDQLMMYKGKVSVCSEIRTKHSTPRGHNVEFFNIKPGCAGLVA